MINSVFVVREKCLSYQASCTMHKQFSSVTPSEIRVIVLHDENLMKKRSSVMMLAQSRRGDLPQGCLIK